MSLTPDEIDELLSQPHIAVVATASADGEPHAMPIWYLWRDGKIFFHTGPTSKKVRNLRANPRITVVVDTKQAPYKAVVVEGTAKELPDDRELGRETAIHYLGEEMGSRYAERSTGGGTLVVVEPTKFISWDYGR